jgi:transcription antitermination factor NusG
VRSRKEEKVIEEIRQKLDEKPEMKVGVNDLKTFSDANQEKVIRGYILGHFNLTPELVKFLYEVPGVINFLNHKRNGEKLPDFVSERVIENFLAKIQEKKVVEVVSHDSKLNIGDLVRITEGMFIDKEGRIVHVDEKKQKVKITIEDSG